MNGVARDLGSCQRSSFDSSKHLTPVPDLAQPLILHPTSCSLSPSPKVFGTLKCSMLRKVLCVYSTHPFLSVPSLHSLCPRISGLKIHTGDIIWGILSRSSRLAYLKTNPLCTENVICRKISLPPRKH